MVREEGYEIAAEKCLRRTQNLVAGIHEAERGIIEQNKKKVPAEEDKKYDGKNFQIKERSSC